MTKYLKPGENLIAFQAFRWCDGTYLEDQDFWRLSGVGRSCYLYSRNTSHISDIRITPDLDAAYKDGTLTVAVEQAGSGKVAVKLLDADGNVVCSDNNVKGKHVFNMASKKILCTQRSCLECSPPDWPITLLINMPIFLPSSNSIASCFNL